MNYESEFILPVLGAFEAIQRGLGRLMINLSSFIAFHARRTPHRCALKYRGQDICYAAFNARIGKVGGWLTSRGIVLRSEREANA
jgi:fatty-acyl-CoA synthase